MNSIVSRSWVVFALLCAAGCGSGRDDGEQAPSALTDVMAVSGVGAVGSRAVALDGGVVVGGTDEAGVTKVARFDEDLQPVWAVAVEGIDGFRSVNVDNRGRILVVGQKADGPTRIVRLKGDGTLDAAVGTPDRIFVGDVVPLSDGRTMLSDTTLLDADFQPVARGNGPGERIVAVSDGYLVLRARNLTVRRLDENGRMRWETSVSVPTATYSTIGLRELSDGSILAAVAGDVSIDNVLVVARLDADGNVLAINRPRIEMKDSEGNLAPVPFGQGLQMASDGNKTYVSFVAIGMDADHRAPITAELDETGAVTAAFIGGGGLVVGEERLISASDSLIATKAMESSCLEAPTFANEALEPRGTTTQPSNMVPDIIEYELTPLTTVTVSKIEVAAERSCRASE